MVKLNKNQNFGLYFKYALRDLTRSKVNAAMFIDNRTIVNTQERIEANVEGIENTGETQVVYIKE